MRRRTWLRGAVTVAAPGLLRAAPAWPSRPLRLVVPFPPGSSPDIVGRLLAEPLTHALRVPVVVDNRPGAGGNLGTAVVAHAAPDGQTWLLTIQGPLVTAPLLSRRLGYDPLRDLAPVTVVASSPNVLVAAPETGAASLPDFVRLARQAQGRWNYGSVGTGSASHLAMESFKSRAGVDLAHIPYPGFPQVVNALLSGQVQAAFMVPGLAMAQVEAGRLRALGVTTLSRSGVLPRLPTLSEQGYAGFEATSWQAVLAPAGTPAAVLGRMSEELMRIIRSDAVRTRLAAQYFSAAGTAPDALVRLMASERERWGRVIRDAGVQPE